MLSKIKSYLNNNYKTNVKPFLEKPIGKFALKWSAVSAMFYTLMSVTVAFMPEAPPQQGEIPFSATLLMIAMSITLIGGMISTSIIAEKFVFLSGKTSKHYEKIKLVLSALLTAACLFSDSDNFFLIYLVPILTMIGTVGVLDSAFKLAKMKIENNVEDEKESGGLDLPMPSNLENPQLKKQQEEIEEEQELGLTNFFTKNRD